MCRRKTTGAESASLMFPGSLSRCARFRHLSGQKMPSEKTEIPRLINRCTEDRIAELEIENSRLRRLVTELLMKNQQLREAQQSLQSDSHQD